MLLSGSEVRAVVGRLYSVTREGLVNECKFASVDEDLLFGQLGSVDQVALSG